MVTLHWVCSLLSYLAFLAGFVAGALFLVQERQLKQKRMGMLFHRLPALDTLDRWNFLAIGIGFALLTLGLVFGIVGSRVMLGRWWRWDPTELLALMLWMAYLVLWLVRMRATLRGRKVALLSMLAFTFALFTWAGVSRWLPTWHGSL